MKEDHLFFFPPIIICIFPSLEMYRDLGDLADCLCGRVSIVVKCTDWASWLSWIPALLGLVTLAAGLTLSKYFLFKTGVNNSACLRKLLWGSKELIYEIKYLGQGLAHSKQDLSVSHCIYYWLQYSDNIFLVGNPYNMC